MRAFHGRAGLIFGLACIGALAACIVVLGPGTEVVAQSEYTRVEYDAVCDTSEGLDACHSCSHPNDFTCGVIVAPPFFPGRCVGPALGHDCMMKSKYCGGKDFFCDDSSDWTPSIPGGECRQTNNWCHDI